MALFPGSSLKTPQNIKLQKSAVFNYHDTVPVDLPGVLVGILKLSQTVVSLTATVEGLGIVGDLVQGLRAILDGQLKLLLFQTDGGPVLVQNGQVFGLGQIKPW